MNQKQSIQGLYCGSVEHSYGFQTAINKQPIHSDIYLDYTGLATDECADIKHHGGKDRALHHYPLEHYQVWQQMYGCHVNWSASGMGENISSLGLTESNVCIGDCYQWGDAIIEVSQPRSPCFKLNKRWEIDDISLQMQSLNLCGWLYRVLKPGNVEVTTPFTLIDRPENSMTIKAVCDIFFGDPLNKTALIRLMQQTKLSDSWRVAIQNRLNNNQVEDWNKRLLGR